MCVSHKILRVCIFSFGTNHFPFVLISSLLDCGGPCESHSLEDQRWTVRLDRDLLHYLASIYPDWFEVTLFFLTATRFVT